MVSVCIATYNGEGFIREQIESILPQLGPHDEIVVSDDGSTDYTISILESLNDPRIRIIKNSGNRGINGNFENAIRHSKGDIIFLADQDDVWENGKIRDCCGILRTHDCVVHDCIITDDTLTPLAPSLFDRLNAGQGFMRNFWRNGFSGSCMCFNRNILPEILPFPTTDKYFYDQWIGLRLEMKHRAVMFHKKGLMKFRRHEATNSTSGRESGKSIFSRLLYRFVLLKDLLIFDCKTAR